MDRSQGTATLKAAVSIKVHITVFYCLEILNIVEGIFLKSMYLNCLQLLMLPGACGPPGAPAAPPAGPGCTPGGRPATLPHMGGIPGTAQALGPRRRAVAMTAVSSNVDFIFPWPGQVDGAWSSWGSWGDCSRPCATGIQTKIRDCNYPDHNCKGEICSGTNFQSSLCNEHVCRK